MGFSWQKVPPGPQRYNYDLRATYDWQIKEKRGYSTRARLFWRFYGGTALAAGVLCLPLTWAMGSSYLALISTVVV
jgi:hypothetical protein